SRSLPNVPGKDSSIGLKQNLTDFFPAFNYTYNLSKSKNLRVYYSGRTRQPSALQLQQVADVTNPFQIRIGNPLLQQEFINNINFSYNSFDAVNYNYFSLVITAGKTANRIVNSIDSASQGILNYVTDKSVQLIKPINVNGVFNASSNITFGIPLHAGSSLKFDNYVFYNKDINEIYKVQNQTKQLSIVQGVDASLDFKDRAHLDLNAQVGYNKTSYSIQKDFNNQYLSQRYSADLNVFLSQRFTVYNSYSYINDGGIANNSNISSASWNASISQRLFKKKNATLNLSVNDILNKNKNLTRLVSENYINNMKAETLKRYFLLTFTYNFNRPGKSNK
ncbi:MAG: outer membrane beta-barrel protein, partial [Segetibacter sp.]